MLSPPLTEPGVLDPEVSPCVQALRPASTSTPSRHDGPRRRGSGTRASSGGRPLASGRGTSHDCQNTRRACRDNRPKRAPQPSGWRPRAESGGRGIDQTTPERGARSSTCRCWITPSSERTRGTTGPAKREPSARSCPAPTINPFAHHRPSRLAIVRRRSAPSSLGAMRRPRWGYRA
jgi:hypothetical protein